MKFFTETSIKIIPLLTVLACSLVVEAKGAAKEYKKIDVKCFVELDGGRRIVSFWNIPTNAVKDPTMLFERSAGESFQHFLKSVSY